MSLSKTVFISYRRHNASLAQSVRQNLIQHGYDVWHDVSSLGSGEFPHTILNEITNREHFLLILTPSALERCTNPEDWVRKEIEQAMRTNTNIVPLFFADFKFSDAIPYLQSEYLKRLPQYNGLIVHWDMFDESMFKLRRQFLGERLDEDNTIISREQMYTTEYRTIDIEVQSIFEQGVQHFQRADWHNAIETFNKAIAKDSLFSEAYFYLGRSYWNIDENIKSSESYLKAVEVDPTHPQINMMRARLKLSLGEYADALIYASLFLIDNLKFAEAHFTFGHIVADMKKYEEAIKFYNQAVKLQESHVSSYFNLGFCYKALKNYPLAIENYSKALKFVPQYLEVYNNRGIIYMIIGEFSKASQDFRKMLVIDPDSELAEKNLRLLEYYKRRRSVF